MRIKGHGKVSRVPFSDGLELYLLPHRVIVRFVRCTKREPAALPPKTAPQLTQDLDVASGFEFAPWRSPGAAGHALRSLAQMPRNVSPGGQVRAKFRLVPLLLPPCPEKSRNAVCAETVRVRGPQPSAFVVLIALSWLGGCHSSRPAAWLLGRNGSCSRRPASDHVWTRGDADAGLEPLASRGGGPQRPQPHSLRQRRSARVAPHCLRRGEGAQGAQRALDECRPAVAAAAVLSRCRRWSGAHVPSESGLFIVNVSAAQVPSLSPSRAQRQKENTTVLSSSRTLDLETIIICHPRMSTYTPSSSTDPLNKYAATL